MKFLSSSNAGNSLEALLDLIDKRFTQIEIKIDAVSGVLAQIQRGDVAALQQAAPEEAQNSLSEVEERLAQQYRPEIKRLQAELTAKSQLLADQQAALGEIERAVYRWDRYQPFVEVHRPGLMLFREAEEKVLALLQKSNAASSGGNQAAILMMMLGAYYLRKEKTQIHRWDMILERMGDGGMISDKEVRRRVQGEDHFETQLSSLNALIFKEVYRDFLSSWFILLEEMRQVPHFTGEETDLTREVQNLSDSLGTQLQYFAEEMDYDIAEAHLFAHYTHFRDLKAVDEVPGPHYEHLTVERDHILAITAYGIKSKYGSTQTTVILAK